MAPKDLSHSPVWFLGALGLIVVYLYDVTEAYKMFNLQGSYTKTTFDHLRSYGGHVFIDDGVNTKFWGLIYVTWPFMLLYLVSTFFRQTQNGYLYKAGHMHWSFLFCAMGGLCYHMKWLRNVEENDLSGSLWSSVFSFHIIVTGMLIILHFLGPKADDLKVQGLGTDVTIMRYMFINIYDFYVLHMFMSMLVNIDAYLLSAYKFSPEDSNFYVMSLFAIFQLYFLFSDLYFTNNLTRYLAGGYITMFVDSFGIMLYQMKTLPGVPLVSVAAFIISATMPALKIYFQSQDSGKVKIK